MRRTRRPEASLQSAKGFCDIDPEAEFVVIPDAGHWVQFEAAAQFNQALLGILSNRRARRT